MAESNQAQDQAALGLDQLLRKLARDLTDPLEPVAAPASASVTDPLLRERLQIQLAEEESALFPKIAHVLFEVLEDRGEPPLDLDPVLTQLLDALLSRADYAAVIQVLFKLRALEQVGPRPDITHLRKLFLSRMSEEPRLGHIEANLKEANLKGAQAKTSAPHLSRYLQAVAEYNVRPVLGLLERLESPDSRVLVSEALVPAARSQPGPFVSRLSSDRPETVRDMVYVLERSNHPQKAQLFEGVLKHRNVVVRQEALNIIARGRNPQVRGLIAAALHDEGAPVRMLAAQLLPQFDRDKALLELIAVVKDSDFERKTTEEKTAVYHALGSTGLPGAVAHCEQFLRQRGGLLNRKKLVEEKLLAIQGLVGACTTQSAKLLEDTAAEVDQPAEVSAAARRALELLKRTLFGDESRAQEHL